MGIKEVIEMINSMQADGVIERYAIGGAVGATFYLEPVATLDVDVFVEFHTEPGSRIASPEPIFKFLRDRGCTMENEHVVIAGWKLSSARSVSDCCRKGCGWNACSCFYRRAHCRRRTRNRPRKR